MVCICLIVSSKYSLDMATTSTIYAQIGLLIYFIPEMHSSITTIPVELHATVDFPCGCDIIPESTSGVYWYRSGNPDVFQKEGISIAAWYAGETHSLPGYGINDDFSITIYNLTFQHDQDLYRCVVHPRGGADECTHDIRLGLYAEPEYPEIKYHRLATGYNVTCSISSIYPLAYPKFTSSAGKGFFRDNLYNRDGTFNTSITTLFPLDMNDAYVECLFETMNLKTITLTPLVDRVISNQPDNGDVIGKNTTRECEANFNGRRQGLWMVLWILLTMKVILFIFVLRKTLGGRLLLAYRNPPNADARDRHDTPTSLDEKDTTVENQNDDESDKTKKALLYLNIHIFIVIILLIVCLVLGNKN